MRRRGGPSGGVSAACLAAVLVSTLSFVPIVQGSRWWFTGVLFAGIAVAAVAGARRLGAPSAAAALLGITTIPLVAVLLAGGGQGLLLILPTRAAALDVIATLQAAFEQVQTDSTPAADTAALALLLGAGVAVAAVLVDVVAIGLRAPLAAMLVVLALALVPGRALNTGTSGLLLVAVALTVLVVIAADRRRRGAPPRLRGLLTGGAVAVVLALAGQIVLPAPFVGQAQGSVLPPLFATGADTLLRLGDDLRRGADSAVLSYTTTSRDPVYLRLAVLEDFSGSTWSPNDADWFPLVRGGAPAAEGVSSSSFRGETTTEVTPSSPSTIGARLPITYPALSVSGRVGDGFRWEQEGLTLERRQTTDAVGEYAVSSADVDTSASVLKTATTSLPAGDQESLTLPASVPSVIARTANAWTRGASTPYAKALAIQNTLRGGSFYYDEQTPAQQGYDGDGLGVIAKFLKVKGGYCIHFASTMAVMARIEGIPSRIVVGYQPGDLQSSGGKRTFQVSTDDLHAWPELYFDKVGWVRFEPTPGRGEVPTYAPVPTASTSAQASVNPRDTASASALPSAAAGTSGSDPTSGVPKVIAGAARGLGIAAVVALLLALPGVLRVLIRRRRLARVGATGPPEVAWRELLDGAVDLGLDPPSRGSPREVESALQSRLGDDPVRAALARLRGAYERQAFGPRAATSSAADVVAVTTALRDGASRWARCTASVLPRSLISTLSASLLAFTRSPRGSDRGVRAVRLGAHR